VYLAGAVGIDRCHRVPGLNTVRNKPDRRYNALLAVRLMSAGLDNEMEIFWETADLKIEVQTKK
jgi:hypothetical protein